jgi:hypothetical protein
MSTAAGRGASRRRNTEGNRPQASPNIAVNVDGLDTPPELNPRFVGHRQTRERQLSDEGSSDELRKGLSVRRANREQATGHRRIIARGDRWSTAADCEGEQASQHGANNNGTTSRHGLTSTSAHAGSCKRPRRLSPLIPAASGRGHPQLNRHLPCSDGNNGKVESLLTRDYGGTRKEANRRALMASLERNAAHRAVGAAVLVLKVRLDAPSEGLGLPRGCACEDQITGMQFHRCGAAPTEQ